MSQGPPGPSTAILAVDTGGTFTDTFIVNEAGDFIVGKAPTTPENVSFGYFNSI